MAHCINIKSKEYIELAKQSVGLFNSNPTLNQKELKARISVWQEYNNTDKFPTLNDIKDRIVINNSSLGVDDNSLLFKQENEIIKLKKKLINKDNINNITKILGLISENNLSDYKSFLNSLKFITSRGFNNYSELTDENKRNIDYQFFNIFNSLFNPKEKDEVLKWISSKNSTNWLNSFREIVDEYLTTNGIYETDNKLINNRLKLLNESLEELNNNGLSLMNSYHSIKNRNRGNKIKKLTDSEVLQINNLRNINKTKLFNDMNIMKSSEVLKNILKNNPDSPLTKLLLNKINVNDVDIELVNIDTFTSKDFNKSGNERYGGYYDPVSNKIFLSKSGTDTKSILHEILHALTNHYLHNVDSEYNKDLNNIFNYIKNNKYIVNDQYPLNNIDEFIVGLFTNINFNNDLKKLPPLNSNKKYPNLFREVWDRLLKLIGLKDSNINKNAYEEALNIATNLLNDSTNEIHWLGLNGYNLNDFANIIPLGSKYENRVTKMKRLRDNFSMQEIKDRSKTISTMFSDIITYYQNLPEYSNLNRQEVIKSVTPSQIFQDIKWELEGVLEDYTEELENANGVRKKQLNTWIDNLNKLLDDNNFNSISIYAINEIGKLEGITFYDNSSLNTEKYNSKEENDYGQSALEELAENYDVGENKILDSWQTNYLFTSVGDSLTQKVASVLRFIPEVNKAGKKQQDGLGFDKRLDPQKTKNVILSGLKDMITSKDMIPLLRKLSKSKPWVNGVINKLINQDGTIKDNELFSQFYQSFRKDLTNMSIVKTIENSDGTLSYTNHIINDVNNINYYISDWKSNISENIVIAKTKSVYSDNKLIKANANSNLKKLKELTDEWNSIKTRGNNETIRNNKEVFINSKLEEIKSQLDAVGVSLDENTIKELIEDSLVTERNGITYNSFNIDRIFETLKNINDWVTKNSDKEASKLIENNNNNYKGLSRLILDNQESIIESYVHENGKGYYSYLQPAYIGKLIKNLKSVHGNKERFNKFIEEEFKQYKDFLYDEQNDRYYISWLNDLIDVTDSEGNIIIDNSKNRDKLDQKIQLNFNKTDYSSLDPINYSLSILSEYFSSEDTAWFRVPILSDAPVARYIKFNKYTGNNFKNNVINDLTNLFLYEYNRIKIVKSMNESGTSKINNFNKRGENFVFMPFFNDYINEIEDMGNINEAQALQRIKDIIRENLDKKSLEDFEYYKNIGILEKVNNNYKYLKGFNINENNIREKFDEFYYNDYLATANIIQLTTTDLAYYKSIEDFQKRNKQINAPGSALNTMAEYNGERLGKDIETTIYLADENVKSNIRQNIISNVLNNNKLSPIEKANIISAYGSNNIVEYDNNIIEVKDSFLNNLEKGFYKKEGKSFKKIEDIDTKSIKGKEFLLVYDNNKYTYVPTKLINVTDAQAYRSLKSYKRIVAMSTGWNNKLENAYKNLIQGKWSMQDYNTIFQAIKPFMYTQHSVETGNEQGTKIKVPVQNKNSETLLLPIFGITKGDSKIRAITQIMDTSDIDVFQFESTVKVGLQGVLDINNMTNRKDIVNYIMNNKDSWQQLSYEDYKIQQPIPDHLQDSSQLFGTQIRKLIMADISPDAIFNIKGFSFTKDQWVKLYQNTTIENIIDSYSEIKDEFNDINKLQYIIEKELFSNDRYAKDLLNSIQLNDEGNFVLPLHEPSQSTRIQQLLNSIWKSRITKQKIKGGSVVQVTSYGLSEDLNIVWNEDGSIKYYEAYLPWWSDEHGRNFIDQETGEIDYNRIAKESPELLEMIAYRIPTEDKYSMIPIKVKGFLPRNAGGNIMLPKEITTITGSDLTKTLGSL